MPPTTSDETTNQIPSWKHAVAGCTAGLSTVLLLQPLDVIKTRLQVQDGAGNLPAYKGTIHALQSIGRQEGWRSLYAGLTPALIGSGVAWGVYFFAYNAAKCRYQEITGQTRLSPIAHLISAAEAGSIVCFVTNPIWVVKTRLQLQRKTALKTLTKTQIVTTAPESTTNSNMIKNLKTPYNSSIAPQQQSAFRGSIFPSRPPELRPLKWTASYGGFLDCLTNIARNEGIKGLYRGLLPSLFLVSHGAIQFTVYEELKSAAYQLRDFVYPLESGANKDASGETAKTLSSIEITACGALSKLAASTVTYPSQVIRSRLQQRMDARTVQYKGVLDVFRKTLAREGVSGFYKGLVPNVLRVMPQSALTFLVYETVLQQLKKNFS